MGIGVEDKTKMEEVQKKRGGTWHRIQIALIILFVLVLAILASLKLTEIKTFEIVGNEHYSDEELLKLVLTEKSDYFSLPFYIHYRHFNEKAIPFIQKLDVKIKSRDEVKIQVYEKIITGSIEYMGSYMYFDKDGMIVESTRNRIENIPIIIGLKFDEITLHENLDVEKQGVYNQILNITQLIHKYELNVDEILFNEKGDITLHLDEIEVLLGMHDMYDESLANLKPILSSLSGKKGKLFMENYSEDNGQVIFKELKEKSKKN